MEGKRERIRKIRQPEGKKKERKNKRRKKKKRKTEWERGELGIREDIHHKPQPDRWSYTSGHMPITMVCKLA